MPFLDALDGFDVSAAVDRMLGQPALWQQALALFVDHFSDWENAWCDSQGDLDKERKQVHALRSASANVGAIRLAAQAALLEDGIAKMLHGLADDASLHLMRQSLVDEFRSSWLSAFNALQQIAHDSGGAA